MISADQHTISEVLGENFIYEIPPYQRPYAWTDHEALQLLEDLEEAADTDSDEPYFLGSVVLIRAPGARVGKVVDGQQRLTTLTILAAVLRDIADDPNEKAALSQIVYTEPNKFKGQVEAVRILAHSEDRTFFRAAIQMPSSTAAQDCPQQPKTDAQRLMWGNATALRDRLTKLDPLRRQEIVTFLLTKCIIVVVATDSRAAALRIFRVLNDRGLDLANSDIIKADLLEKFDDGDEQNSQAARWREFEIDLGRDDFESLLEHLRFIHEKARNRTTLSEAFATRFKGSSASKIRSFFDGELAPAKLWFTRIIEGDTSAGSSDGVNYGAESLAGLNLLPNKDWTAVALAILLRHGSTVKASEYLRALEGLAWAMQLAKRYDTERLNRYALLLKFLEEDKGLFTQNLNLTEAESYFAWTSLNGPLYITFPTRVVRAMLERLDRLLAEQPVVWDGQKSVEHILPQNPQSGTWTQFDRQQKVDYVHRLGNLVLLTKRKNSSASNYEYAKKKDVYFGVGQSAAKKRATYAAAQELAHVNEWTPNSFNSRQEHHSDILSQHWGVNKSAKISFPDGVI